LVKNIIETGIPKIKQYMSETGRALKVSEVAEHLEVVDATAFGLLDLMCEFGIIDKVKRGRTYYFLNGVYSDEQIRAMLPPEKAPRLPRPRRQRVSKPQVRKISFKDEYLSDLEERASSGEGLSALAFLSLPQEETSETPSTKPEPTVEMMSTLMNREKPEQLIKNEPFATIQYLPKNVRLLSQSETSYLKSLLKCLSGGEGLERYKTVFSKFSALENGRYGEVFYFSTGSNPWDNVRKVSVDSSISDYIVLPIIEANRWVSWNDFLACFNETRRYSRGEYDEMLDKFIESEDKLVEIAVENRGTVYVKHMLKKKIEERGITDQIETSRVDEWIYLEKIG